MKYSGMGTCVRLLISKHPRLIHHPCMPKEKHTAFECCTNTCMHMCGMAVERMRNQGRGCSYLRGATLFSCQEGKVYSAPSRS